MGSTNVQQVGGCDTVIGPNDLQREWVGECLQEASSRLQGTLLITPWRPCCECCSWTPTLWYCTAYSHPISGRSASGCTFYADGDMASHEVLAAVALMQLSHHVMCMCLCL
jgi:hypothetical protein